MAGNEAYTEPESQSFVGFLSLVSRIRWRILFALFIIGVVQFGVPPGVQASDPILFGYRDFSYESGVGGNSEVTSEKPESKLWWNDGYWWASMWSNQGSAYHIFRLNTSNQTWIDTNTRLDPRKPSRADVLWDGTKLYVVSHYWDGGGGDAAPAGQRGQLFRYSYNAGNDTYTIDPGFPVEVNRAKSETLVIDKASNGQLWVTWVQNGKVMVNRTLNGDDSQWGEPFALSGTEANVSNDDISSVITYNQHVGIMWSNQRTSTRQMYFAVHPVGAPDTQWVNVRAYGISGDDHINLKSIEADSDGNVYAAVKTSKSSELIVLLVCKRNINRCKQESDWSAHTVYNSSEHGPTRPALLIDMTNRNLYIFTRNKDDDGNGIYYKMTSLDNIQFSAGSIGIPFIKSATETGINDPTSTKQNLTSTTGLVVLASDKGARYYFHNHLSLTGKPQYMLTVNVQGQGSVEPSSGVYDEGTQVSVTATPAPGWKFDRWEGDYTGTNNPATITMNANKTVTAVFSELPPDSYTLNVSVDPASAGSITLNPPPVNGAYDIGQEVTLTANKNTGWVFREWVGAPISGSTDNPVTITMNDNYSITAHFDAVQHQLTVNTVGEGTVTPSSGLYNEGTTVSLEAKPDPGWVFTGWSGDLTGDENPAPLVMNAPKTVTATFERQYALNVTIDGEGAVTLNPPGGTYLEGTQVTLTATPDPSWVFTGWSGDLTGSTNPVTIVMDGDKNVTAGFALPQYTLTVNIEGMGSVALSPPGGEYAEGQLVDLVVTPETGWSFAGWSGDLSGDNNPASIVMDGDKTITATFSPPQQMLLISRFGAGEVLVDPPGVLHATGSTVTLTANPASGWKFSGWSGDLTGTENPATLTMDEDKTVTATFVQTEPAIEIQISASPMTATVGQEITYTYTVVNIGDEDLNNVSAEDDRLGPVPLDKTKLASGESAVGYLTHFVTQVDLPGPLETTATAWGSTLDETVSDDATVLVTLRQLPFVFYLPFGLGSAPPEGTLTIEEHGAAGRTESGASGSLTVEELETQPKERK